MELVIKLARCGKKKKCDYRIIVVPKWSAFPGLPKDYLGNCTEIGNGTKYVFIDRIKLGEWLKKGAVLSKGMCRVLRIGDAVGKN